MESSQHIHYYGTTVQHVHLMLIVNGWYDTIPYDIA